MKTKQLKTIESYFKTENEHWNEFIFNMINEELQQKQFDNLEIPLQLFNYSIHIYIKYAAEPLKAIQLFNKKIDEYQLNNSQKLFVYECIYRYLSYSEFDIDLSSIEQLVKGQKQQLVTIVNNTKPLANNIRETLKTILYSEIAQLPETLKTLEPLQRLNILCKLVSFVLPKVEAVSLSEGEGDI